MDPLLLSAVVGMGLNIFGSRKARKAEKKAGQEYERNTFEDIKLSRQANQLSNNELDLRMKQEELAFEEDTLATVENLREVMAAQRAMFAFQGRTPGVGSTLAIQNRSLSNFASNEKSRKLSFGFSQHFLKSQQVINNIGTEMGVRDSFARASGMKSKLKARRDERNIGLAKDTFNMIPFNTLFDKKGTGSGKGLLSSLL